MPSKRRSLFDAGLKRRQRALSIHDIREAELAEIRKQQGVRTYGFNGTIHGNEELNIEVGPDGRVVAVWFRCMQLPYTVSHIAAKRAADVQRGTLPRLVAVEVIG